MSFIRQNRLFVKICNSVLIVCFILSMTITGNPNAFAQTLPATILNLPVPGAMVKPSDAFTPAHILGINIHPDNPLRFDFVIDQGDETFADDAFQAEASRQIKYFLAALTTPEDEMWVNLSPYEKDRIVPQAFGQTEMGRDLLAQDYLLKQLTASLMYPQDDLGEKFWQQMTEKAKAAGVTDVPVNTFNKVWIIPEKAVVYEHAKGAFVVESHLKVMLDEDYLALAANQNSTKHGLGNISADEIKPFTGVAANVVRDVILPEIEKEVNNGKTFANLRQIYNAVILASWYKKSLKESLLGQTYVDQHKVKGLGYKKEEGRKKMEEKGLSSFSPLPSSVLTPQDIYNQYLAAFKKGVYDYIKEEYDPSTQQIIPKKYFSGGMKLALRGIDEAMAVTREDPRIGKILARRDAAQMATVDFAVPTEHLDKAMQSAKVPMQIFDNNEMATPPQIRLVVKDWLSVLEEKDPQYKGLLRFDSGFELDVYNFTVDADSLTLRILRALTEEKDFPLSKGEEFQWDKEIDPGRQKEVWTLIIPYKYKEVLIVWLKVVLGKSPDAAMVNENDDVVKNYAPENVLDELAEFTTKDTANFFFGIREGKVTLAWFPTKVSGEPRMRYHLTIEADGPKHKDYLVRFEGDLMGRSWVTVGWMQKADLRSAIRKLEKILQNAGEEDSPEVLVRTLDYFSVYIRPDRLGGIVSRVDHKINRVLHWSTATPARFKTTMLVYAGIAALTVVGTYKYILLDDGPIITPVPLQIPEKPASQPSTTQTGATEPISNISDAAMAVQLGFTLDGQIYPAKKVLILMEPLFEYLNNLNRDNLGYVRFFHRNSGVFSSQPWVEGGGAEPLNEFPYKMEISGVQLREFIEANSRLVEDFAREYDLFEFERQSLYLLARVDNKKVKKVTRYEDALLQRAKELAERFQKDINEMRGAVEKIKKPDGAMITDAQKIRIKDEILPNLSIWAKQFSRRTASEALVNYLLNLNWKDELNKAQAIEFEGIAHILQGTSVTIPKSNAERFEVKALTIPTELDPTNQYQVKAILEEVRRLEARDGAMLNSTFPERLALAKDLVEILEIEDNPELAVLSTDNLSEAELELAAREISTARTKSEDTEMVTKALQRIQQFYPPTASRYLLKMSTYQTNATLRGEIQGIIYNALTVDKNEDAAMGAKRIYNYQIFPFERFNHVSGIAIRPGLEPFQKLIQPIIRKYLQYRAEDIEAWMEVQEQQRAYRGPFRVNIQLKEFQIYLVTVRLILEYGLHDKSYALLKSAIFSRREPLSQDMYLETGERLGRADHSRLIKWLDGYYARHHDGAMAAQETPDAAMNTKKEHVYKPIAPEQMQRALRIAVRPGLEKFQELIKLIVQDYLEDNMDNIEASVLIKEQEPRFQGQFRISLKEYRAYLLALRLMLEYDLHNNSYRVLKSAILSRQLFSTQDVKTQKGEPLMKTNFDHLSRWLGEYFNQYQDSAMLTDQLNDIADSIDGVSDAAMGVDSLEYLAAIGDRQAVLQIANQPENWNTYPHDLIKAVAALGLKQFLPQIVNQIELHGDPLSRVAIEAIEDLNGQEYIPFLTELSQKGKTQIVRQSASNALRFFKVFKAFEEFIDDNRNGNSIQITSDLLSAKMKKPISAIELNTMIRIHNAFGKGGILKQQFKQTNVYEIIKRPQETHLNNEINVLLSKVDLWQLNKSFKNLTKNVFHHNPPKYFYYYKAEIDIVNKGEIQDPAGFKITKFKATLSEYEVEEYTIFEIDPEKKVDINQLFKAFIDAVGKPNFPNTAWVHFRQNWEAILWAQADAASLAKNDPTQSRVAPDKFSATRDTAMVGKSKPEFVSSPDGILQLSMDKVSPLEFFNQDGKPVHYMLATDPQLIAQIFQDKTVRWDTSWKNWFSDPAEIETRLAEKKMGVVFALTDDEFNKAKQSLDELSKSETEKALAEDFVGILLHRMKQAWAAIAVIGSEGKTELMAAEMTIPGMESAALAMLETRPLAEAVVEELNRFVWLQGEHFAAEVNEKGLILEDIYAELADGLEDGLYKTMLNFHQQYDMGKPFDSLRLVLEVLKKAVQISDPQKRKEKLNEFYSDISGFHWKEKELQSRKKINQMMGLLEKALLRELDRLDKDAAMGGASGANKEVFGEWQQGVKGQPVASFGWHKSLPFPLKLKLASETPHDFMAGTAKYNIYVPKEGHDFYVGSVDLFFVDGKLSRYEVVNLRSTIHPVVDYWLDFKLDPLIGESFILDSAMAVGQSQVTVHDSQEEVGGIDMNAAMINMDVQKEGQGVQLPVSELTPQNFNPEGLVPIIINVTPVTNLPLVLGLLDPNETPTKSADNFPQELSPADRQKDPQLSRS